MLPKPLATAIVVVVTLVWAGNFIAPFLVPAYRADPLIHTAFMAVVGAAFALSRRPKNGNDNHDRDDPA